MLFSSSQLLELFVILCIVEHFRYDIFAYRSASAHAQSKSGPVRSDSMPGRLYRFIVPLQMLASFPIPIVYVIAVVNAQLHQPSWMNAFALPDVVYGMRMDGMWKNTARLLASVASVVLENFADEVFVHLDDQFHPIGRREKQRVVQTGPYAWVRHPLYVWILLEETIWSIMFWSYAPLFTVVATAMVLAVKIHIEEEAIQRDDAIREEYHAYMKNVPARFVPYVW